MRNILDHFSSLTDFIVLWLILFGDIFVAIPSKTWVCITRLRSDLSEVECSQKFQVLLKDCSKFGEFDISDTSPERYSAK